MFLWSGVAAAGVVVYSLPTDFSGIPITDTYNFSGSFGAGSGPASGGGEALLFPLFNPTLGTLQSVSISVTATIGTNNDPGSRKVGTPSTISVTNDSGTQGFNETFDTSIYLMDNKPTCLSNVENDTTTELLSGCLLSGLSLPYSNSESIGAGATATHSLANSGSLTATSGPGGTITNLSEFQGSGTIPLQIFLETTNLVTNDSGPAGDTIAAFVGAETGSITYDYTSDVPEPCTIVLTGGIFLSLVFLQRRKWANN
jgi:hypothetical protein